MYNCCSRGVRITVSVTIAILGLLVLMFGISAEGIRQTVILQGVFPVVVLVVSFNAAYPSYCNESILSSQLSIAAAMVLFVSQMIANICGGCIFFCTYNRSPLPYRKKVYALICFGLSWLFFAISFFLLVDGAIANKSSVGYDCNVKLGMMGVGAPLSVFCTGLAIAYFLLATQAKSLCSNPDGPS